MERRGSTATLLALLVLATLLRSSCGGAAGGSEGKHGRKIIIHVPYYIKNHHHTHTVYKYVKKDQHGAGGDSGEGGASLDQEHKGHGAGEAGDDFGDHHHHDGDAEFVGHHHHHHHHGPHDDGEATHTTPQALGLHGEPRPDDHHQHPHRYHHDDGGDYHQHPQQHHGGNAGHHDGDLHPNGNAGHHDGDFHHNQHQQQRLREEGSHFHHHEQGGRQHHHHHHEGDGERGHAHFHSKFVIGTNDGHLHESDSSESSEHPLHGGEFEPHRGHAPFTGPRENEDPRYEQVNHGYGSFSSHPVHENGEDSDQDEKYHNNQPQYDGFNSLSEQRPEESQQHSSPLYARDQTTPYNRHHYDKFEDITEPIERRGLKKRNGKRSQERPRRQKYEVREPIPEQTSPRYSYTSYDHPTEHQSKGHRKHNQEWR